VGGATAGSSTGTSSTDVGIDSTVVASGVMADDAVTVDETVAVEMAVLTVLAVAAGCVGDSLPVVSGVTWAILACRPPHDWTSIIRKSATATNRNLVIASSPIFSDTDNEHCTSDVER
jgi:hypothetical protein